MVITYILVGVLIVAIGVLFTRFMKNLQEIKNRRKEMDMATKIQMSMLPECDLALPQLQIGACMVPAKNVGGDLYYYYIRNNYLYFCIGDVSGKGMSAALFMSKTTSLFACISRYAFRADDIAEQLNIELCQHNSNSMFVTLFVGIFNIETCELQYCNAGHDEPLYWDGVKSHAPYYLSTSDNIPLGIDEDEKFTQGTIKLKMGSKLLLYTDGIIEAKRKDTKMYGPDRLVNCFNVSGTEGSVSLCDCILADVRAFVKGNEQSDDITMLAISIKRIDRTKVLKNEVAELKKLHGFFDEIVQVLNSPREVFVKIRLAVDEVMTNCVHYAYPNQKGKDISIRTFTANNQLVFVITDEGVPFNPLAYEERALDDVMDDNVDDMPIGGLGIPLMKKIFDKLEYKREDNKNVLILKKSL